MILILVKIKSYWIKLRMIIFKNAKMLLNYEEDAYFYLNNTKYHYISVTEPNALLTKFY